MYDNMFVHNNIGGTLKKKFHPPFWGGTAPLYISTYIFKIRIRTKNRFPGT